MQLTLFINKVSFFVHLYVSRLVTYLLATTGVQVNEKINEHFYKKSGLDKKLKNK